MDISKSIALIVIGVVGVLIVILEIQLILRRFKKTDEDGRLNISYGVWFTFLIIAALTIMLHTTAILNEAVDIIYKNESSSKIKDVAKTSTLLIGFSALWFFVCFFISGYLSTVFVGKRSDQNEINTNNISYFLIKGSLLTSLILCLTTAFEKILRSFIPSIQIPFYH